MASATRLAERDGIRSHGLVYVPIYAEHLPCGKHLGVAVLKVDQPRRSVVQVDAGNVFAHAEVDAGWRAFNLTVRS